jgi:hypothetical protein
MNQGPRWVLLIRKNGGGKSRATVPLKGNSCPVLELFTLSIDHFGYWFTS